jgi:CRISPR/Cas system-associated endonuclease/helicase Cas3
MADMMTFPPTFEEFIKQYEFKDKEEVYTNGAELVPSFRVMQAWEHYTNQIQNNINDIDKAISLINHTLSNIEEAII